MSDDGDYELSIGVDIVEVEASGPDEEVVEHLFDRGVEEAFYRYNQHIEEDEVTHTYE